MPSRILVIGTGGSISTPGRHDLDLHEYGDFSKPLEVDEFLARFAPVLPAYTLVPKRFRAIDSVVMDPPLWLALHRFISDEVRADAAISGVVVTHGTSTLEETAYFLHLTLRVPVPVVLVGAQRPPNGLSSDAGLNLLNALRVAAAPAVRGCGVLVVMNTEIHSARDVTKSSNFGLQAFGTPDFGMLGQVEPNGDVAMYRLPLRRHGLQTEFEVDGQVDLPAVEIVYSYAGASGASIAALVDEGCKAIVFAGMPPGRASPAQQAQLVLAAGRGVLIIQCSRAGSGRIVQRSRDLAMGFIGADNLNPQKARVLAMLALATTADRAAIGRMFSEY